MVLGVTESRQAAPALTSASGQTKRAETTGMRLHRVARPAQSRRSRRRLSPQVFPSFPAEAEEKPRMIDLLTDPQAWASSLTLTLQEIIHDIDNVIFRTIVSGGLS